MWIELTVGGETGAGGEDETQGHTSVWLPIATSVVGQDLQARGTALDT